mmetsp:Transcript_93701/g.201071  ORF Transcript_93701/g.201071 Transcript_93701/m.201071 type:complete len:216 (+) Transcript_93701:803-1450(+)
MALGIHGEHACSTISSAPRSSQQDPRPHTRTAGLDNLCAPAGSNMPSWPCSSLDASCHTRRGNRKVQCSQGLPGNRCGAGGSSSAPSSRTKPSPGPGPPRTGKAPRWSLVNSLGRSTGSTKLFSRRAKPSATWWMPARSCTPPMSTISRRPAKSSWSNQRHMGSGKRPAGRRRTAQPSRQVSSKAAANTTCCCWVPRPSQSPQRHRRRRCSWSAS